MRLDPRYEFQMRGIGYGHPTFRHGALAGRVDGRRRAAHAAGRAARATRPTSTSRRIVDATYTVPDGTVEQGIGILEQLAVGPHPSGLTGLVDGFGA